MDIDNSRDGQMAMASQIRSFVRYLTTAVLLSGLVAPSPVFSQVNKTITAPAGAISVPKTNPPPPSLTTPIAPDPPDPASQTGTSDIAYPATFANVIKVALRMHAFDLNNDAVIDDLARLYYCQIYQAHHLNEFDWRKIRIALREKIQQELPTYPTTLFLDRIEEFTTYDFKTGRLQMDPKSILDNVIQLRLTPDGVRDACGARLTTMDQDFIVSLNQSISINGIKMDEDEAAAVVQGLQNDTIDNTVKRHGYGRYFITIKNTVVPPMEMKNTILFFGSVDRITFYEDNIYQKPFWSGINSVPDYHAQPDAQDSIPFKGVDVPSLQ